MAGSDISKDDKLSVFEEIIQVSSPVWTWVYDKNASLLHSNCPSEAIFDHAFELFGFRQEMLKRSASHRPCVLAISPGLFWYIAFEYSGGELFRCVCLGPVSPQKVSIPAVATVLNSMNSQQIDPLWKHEFLKVLKDIPIEQSLYMQRYLITLNYLLTGQRSDLGDIYYDTAAAIAPESDSSGPHRSRRAVYRAEKALLEAVKNGSSDYLRAFDNSVNISSGVPIQSKDPLRRAKTSLVVFVTLVSRAAMAGGLSPDEAYPLGDHYIQIIESSDSMSQLLTISRPMYEDFLKRVRRVRMAGKYSRPVRDAISFIESNVARRLTAADVASSVGYSEYYLTRRFRQETGQKMGDFIVSRKLERARFLLADTDHSITRISQDLSFSSRSYFSRLFQKAYGVTPAKYRADL